MPCHRFGPRRLDARNVGKHSIRDGLRQVAADHSADKAAHSKGRASCKNVRMIQGRGSAGFLKKATTAVLLRDVFRL